MGLKDANLRRYTAAKTILPTWRR